MEISFLLSLTGIVFLVIALFSIFFYSNTPEILKESINSIREGTRIDYWLIIIGPVFLGIGAYYLHDGHNKKKEIEEYLNTDSKATFIRNMDDIEYLAWRLGEPYVTRVIKKKKEFRIK